MSLVQVLVGEVGDEVSRIHARARECRAQLPADTELTSTEITFASCDNAALTSAKGGVKVNTGA